MMLKVKLETSSFFAALLQDNDYISLGIDSQKEKLISEGLLSQDEESFIVDDEEEMYQRLEILAKQMLKSVDGYFTEIWEHFSKWLANIVDREKHLINFCDHADINLVDTLKSFLLSKKDVE